MEFVSGTMNRRVVGEHIPDRLRKRQGPTSYRSLDGLLVILEGRLYLRHDQCP